MKIYFIIIVLLISLGAKAQQDPLISQYMFNKMLVNPAGAGSDGPFNAMAIYRQQWVNMPGAPVTMGLLADGQIKNMPLGVGLAAFRTKLGPLSFTRLNSNFSYIFNVTNESTLSLGIQAGIIQYDVDPNGLNLHDPIHEDQTFSSQILKRTIPDFGFGTLYQMENFFVGISIPHILQTKIKFLNREFENGQADKEIFAKVFRHYYLVSGYTLPLEGDLTLQGTTMFKYVQDAPLTADINLISTYKELFWAGVGYRTSFSKTLIFLAGVNVGKGIDQNIRIGYSFDLNLSKTVAYGGATHEIMLSYNYQPKKRGGKPYFSNGNGNGGKRKRKSKSNKPLFLNN